MSVSACDSDDASFVGEVRYQNGLTVPRPDFLDENLQDTRDIRRPLTVIFDITSDDPPEDAESCGADMKCTRETLDGGSGGTHYRLTAWRPAGSDWITLVAEQQNEGPGPSFALPLKMLEEARIGQ